LTVLIPVNVVANALDRTFQHSCNRSFVVHASTLRFG
jgi:hypothetical protein